jgi:hypothetical protein
MCRRRRSHGGNGDLTIEHVLAEPIVCDLMRADGVDPAAFEALLRSIAARPAVPRSQVRNEVPPVVSVEA